jgi:hypothetical protein
VGLISKNQIKNNFQKFFEIKTLKIVHDGLVKTSTKWGKIVHSQL